MGYGRQLPFILHFRSSSQSVFAIFCRRYSSIKGKKCCLFNQFAFVNIHSRYNYLECSFSTNSLRNIDESVSHCIDLVKKRDFEGFLGILLLPKACQTDIFAIRALNVELAMVRDQIERYSGTADIYRLQFWKDALEVIYGGKKGPIPRQPVTSVLQFLSAEKDCSYYLSQLSKLIESRQKTLGDRSFESTDQLELYGQNTHGVLLRMTVQSIVDHNGELKANEAELLDMVCNQIGSALGICTHLRSTAPLASRGIVILPSDLLSLHNLSQEMVFNRSNPEALRLLANDLANLAAANLRKSRQVRTKIPKLYRRAFLCAVGADNFLNQLKKVKFGLFDSKLQRTSGLVPWQMFWKLISGRY